jgi:hypothetical protein
LKDIKSLLKVCKVFINQSPLGFYLTVSKNT